MFQVSVPLHGVSGNATGLEARLLAFPVLVGFLMGFVGMATQPETWSYSQDEGLELYCIFRTDNWRVPELCLVSGAAPGLWVPA